MCNPACSRRSTIHKTALLVMGLALLAGCGGAPLLPATPTATAVVFASSTPTWAAALPSQTPELAPTSTRQSAVTIQPTAQPVLEVCSPLEDIDISELNSPDLLKTMFDPPRPGMDDGHQGVDFSYWTRGERATMRGHPIQAVFAGRIAGVIPNRVPYGYALIIETPLHAFSAAQLRSLALPEPAPTVVPSASLYCPTSIEDEAITGGAERSLYLLYAHMNEPPTAQTGDTVTCGETIGAVGTTGNSVNDHLHLEARLGPSGVTFPVMAHYDNAATPQEMRTYCTWRVSGLFQMIDPLVLFTLQR